MDANELFQLYGAGERIFSGSDLRGSDLRGSDLRECYLRECNLSGSNLSGSDLRGSNLRGSHLRGSNLSEANLPSPGMILLAQWGEVSDALCGELMRYDAANHPDPSSFDRWAETGLCPYEDCLIQRSVNFKQKKSSGRPGPGDRHMS